MWGENFSQVVQFSYSPSGKVFDKCTNASSCHLAISPWSSSHFRVENCTSRCISKLAPPLSAVIRENAFSVPRAEVKSFLLSPSRNNSVFGMPWRSSTAIRERMSAAFGSCFFIWSKDTFQVWMTELGASKSLLGSCRALERRSAASNSLSLKISRYSLMVISLSLMKAAACVIASGKLSSSLRRS